ncbi:FecR family protein [Flavivirga eckloniae]|uniref:Anti-sigma factor n=1 Tax=Flavivirga eckloniae TaxID=1803846 RepID=A0A2K9PUF6_9FLAO|nr:FecR domain-containing protein [Flavivirga eckloniae]AUP80679.1 hypothetical protein C1H87_18955 [Flavivirga eckloniae]
MTQKIDNLIVKYITKSATAEDLDLLSEWIKDPENKKEFKDYVQTHYAITYNLENIDPEETIAYLLKRIQKEKSISYRLINQPVVRYIAAASVVLFITMGIWFTRTNTVISSDVIEPIIVNNQIEAGTNKAVLILEDGSNIILHKDRPYNGEHVSSNNEELVYNNNATNVAEVVYNVLSVPRGGQFSVKLSDGTKVWLNSESRLKYPKSFIEGQDRDVELVYGEAYFDVSPSTDHNGATFKVHMQNQEVEVLGTEFNIKAYQDETNIYTTLVEGKVAVTTNDKNEILKPGEQSNLNIETKVVQINTIDIFREIAWKDGVFSFKGKKLKDIMTVLSRWYDMEVVYENKSLENKRFNGTLYKNQKIYDIVNSMKETNVINTYEIRNNTLIIK